MKVCSVHGCPELTKTSHCEVHTKQSHGWHTSTRVTPPGWGKMRKRILRRDGRVCIICKRRATVVDHLVPMAWDGEALNPKNLRAMCPRCHDAKTSHERTLGKEMKKMNGEDRKDAIVSFVQVWRG